jgi:ketol-acid reductoisomerase
LETATGDTNFEKTPAGDFEISSKYYDNGVLMVAMVKAGCWWL